MTVTNLWIQFFGMEALYNPSIIEIEQIETTRSVIYWFFFFLRGPPSFLPARNCLVCATEAIQLLAKSVSKPAPKSLLAGIPPV